MSLRNHVRGKDEKSSSRCREFCLQVMPPIVADTLQIGALPPQRASVELYSLLPCKAKKTGLAILVRATEGMGYGSTC